MSKISPCRVCPAWMNFIIDNPVRRLVFKPDRVLQPYLEEGMTFLDLGCGGGAYSIAGAELVGEAGRVISVDIQEKMLEKVEVKIKRKGLGRIVETHLAKQTDIDLAANVDFALAMFMVHETPDKEEFFSQVREVLKDGSKMLVAEPKGHVSNSGIEEQIAYAVNAGFRFVARKKINFFSRGYLLENCG